MLGIADTGFEGPRKLCRARDFGLIKGNADRVPDHGRAPYSQTAYCANSSGVALFRRLTLSQEVDFDGMEMSIHGGGCCFEITLGDGADQQIMLAETVMVGWRTQAVVAQPTPNDSAAHRVQSVEQSDQDGVVRCLGHEPMQAVVAILILPPGGGNARGRQALAHLARCRRRWR